MQRWQHGTSVWARRLGLAVLVFGMAALAAMAVGAPGRETAAMPPHTLHMQLSRRIALLTGLGLFSRVLATWQVAETCQEFISANCKASVLRVFPRQFLNVDISEVLKAATEGDRAAQTARKLLMDNRFRK